MPRIIIVLLALLAPLFAGGETSVVEATALDGRDLLRPELPAEVEENFERQLAAAQADYEREPSADHLIWLGRRTAYVGRYREAIELFGRGVEEFPDDPRFLRHRGHRYITTRQLNKAVADLSKAASMIEGQPDQVEPDGLPNVRGIPTSTLHTNVYYHLGLAHYLRGDFEAALSAFRHCLDAAKNPDMEAATRYWLYLTQKRLGMHKAAQANLEAVDGDWDIIENHAYHRLLLLFRDDLEAEQVMPAGDDALENATLGYGIAAWHRFNDRPEQERVAIERVLAGSQWAAFGYIAAEADRVRQQERAVNGQAVSSSTSFRCTRTATAVGRKLRPADSRWARVKAAPNKRISDE